MALAGIWLSPLPLFLAEKSQGVFSTPCGGSTLTLDGRSVTLASGGESASGVASIDFERIRWDSGACWARQAGVRNKSADAGADRPVVDQPLLLSTRQVDCVIDRVNEEVDIWLLSEKQERKIIAVPVKETNKYLKECLESFMAPDWVRAIAVLLDEAKDPADKTRELKDIIARNIRKPLVAALNTRIDVPLLSEKVEKKMLSVIADQVLAQIVELVVVGLEKTGFA